MEQREKLMKLISEFLIKSDDGENIENMADYLIDHGVVALSCRCKDCEHQNDEDVCPIYTWWLCNKEYFFCAYAKRKGGDE